MNTSSFKIIMNIFICNNYYGENALIPHFNNKNLKVIDAFPDGTFKLSSNGYKFFIETFQAFVKNKDRSLNNHELCNLFSTSPRNSWKNKNTESTLTNSMNSIPLQGFLASVEVSNTATPEISVTLDTSVDAEATTKAAAFSSSTTAVTTTNATNALSKIAKTVKSVARSQINYFW
ncbi:hypothetical protein BCR36DRAFT_371461 [Piromyces finnis]|uniref:Uncharacterized protein n=1 Tax=Piromyces finnis TaxID=1754191 RepID=A0A1Y1V5M5_9FUNG|nr:hypothetical protein BCR36DRAFT_371461 [Piromyces finnis]|eukprot:ORX47820.1 hypothetical protein BCR36DRAFT_371461 [Piromyces finnis]